MRWKRNVKVEVLTKQIFHVKVNNARAFREALRDITDGIKGSGFIGSISCGDPPFDAQCSSVKVFPFFKPPFEDK